MRPIFLLLCLAALLSVNSVWVVSVRPLRRIFHVPAAIVYRIEWIGPVVLPVGCLLAAAFLYDAILRREQA